MMIRGSCQKVARGPWVMGYLTDGAGTGGERPPVVFYCTEGRYFAPRDVHAMRFPLLQIGRASLDQVELYHRALKAGYPEMEEPTT
jgi:hypothetical protein